MLFLNLFFLFKNLQTYVCEVRGSVSGTSFYMLHDIGVKRNFDTLDTRFTQKQRLKKEDP